MSRMYQNRYSLARKDFGYIETPSFASQNGFLPEFLYGAINPDKAPCLVERDMSANGRICKGDYMLLVLALAVATPSPVADAAIEGAEAPRTLEDIIGPKPTDEDLAASMQRIFDSAPSNNDAEQADKNVQDAIRRYVAKRDSEPMKIPDSALPQQGVAKPNATGALLPSMIRQSPISLPASQPPDFWQRNRWAWPTVQWAAFLSLIGFCIGAARWRRTTATTK